MRLVLALAAACLAFARVVPPVRLSRAIAPQSYAVQITLDPAQHSFEGLVRIAIEIHQPAPVIWMNGRDLRVLEASIQSGTETVPVKRIIQSGDFLGLQPAAMVAPGSAVVSVRYRGTLRAKPALGLYHVEFEGRWYAFTTFAPAEARRAFPCFDEPRFKTPWQITLQVPKDLRAFSNAPWESNIESGGMRVIRFAPTEPLPAELVAFAVGPLDTFDGSAGQSRVLPRIVAPAGHARAGAFAVATTEELLARFEAYTGIPYPFQKLDEAALPDSIYSAVENPGLITFRMGSLLVPPQAPASRRRAVRQVIAHELAHQWFGDLVTQDDWRDVWLSEGFATWLSRRILNPDRSPGRHNLSAILAREKILRADADPESPPVRPAAGEIDATPGLYNPFIYEKGAAVLLMLEGWLGQEPFRDGLRLYLKEHRYGSASTADLAAALREATGTDTTAVLHEFLDRRGAPEVRVRAQCDSRGEAQVHLSGSALSPVCFRSQGSPARCAEVGPSGADLTLSACPAWIYPNAGGTGYYRTVWSAGALAQIAPDLSALTAAERLTLSFDVGAEMRARRLTMSQAAPVLRLLLRDPEPLVAEAARQAAEGD